MNKTEIERPASILFLTFCFSFLLLSCPTLVTLLLYHHLHAEEGSWVSSPCITTFGYRPMAFQHRVHFTLCTLDTHSACTTAGGLSLIAGHTIRDRKAYSRVYDRFISLASIFHKSVQERDEQESQRHGFTHTQMTNIAPKPNCSDVNLYWSSGCDEDHGQECDNRSLVFLFVVRRVSDIMS